MWHFTGNFTAVVPAFHGSGTGDQHPGLTIAALRNLVGNPGRRGSLAIGIIGKPFDRDDLFAADRANVKHARAFALIVDQYRAGAADVDAAAIFCAS